MFGPPETLTKFAKSNCKKFYSIKRPIPLTRRRKGFKFIPHVCCRECSSLERRLIEDNQTKFNVTKDSILMYNENPFLVPLYLEFKRKNDDEEDCGYLSPCGVELYTLEAIYRYLEVSESKLNINQFTLTARIELFRDHSYFKVYAMKRDITEGLESTPIQAINEYEPKLYSNFTYIKERQFAIDLELIKSFTDGDELKSCDCDGDCSAISNCKCRQLTIEENKVINPNNKAGYEFNMLFDQPKTAIYECNPGCKCSNRSRSCLNRVVQNGIKVRLQVYKTRNCGFGVRTLHDLPKGAFVCSYEGRIVKNTRSCVEDENAYLMNLSYKHCYLKIVGDKNESTEFSREINEVENADTKLLNKNKTKEEIYNFITIHDLTQVSDLDLTESDSSFSDLTITDFSDLSSSSELDDNTSQENNSHDVAKEKIPDAKRNTNPIEHCESTSQMNGEQPRKKLKRDEPDQQVDSDYLIDCKEFGNCSRFINHSCNPNLACQPVFISTQNPLFVHFAMFTIKDVKAYSELTFDYFIGDDRTANEFNCKCRSNRCKSRLRKRKT